MRVCAIGTDSSIVIGLTLLRHAVQQTFGRQLTSMSNDFAKDNVFSARRYVNDIHVSTVYWSVCQVRATLALHGSDTFHC